MKVSILAILMLMTTTEGVLAQDVSAIPAEPASVRLVDLLRFRDQQARVFEGVGLVTGLDGSGDRLKSEDRLRPLAGVLERHNVPFLQTLDLLKTGNSALVMVQCKVPASGGTEGDQFDLTVSTLLDANDLEGGVLLTTLLRDPLFPDATPTMQASGAIELAEEVSSRGSILDGAQLLKPILRTAIGHLRQMRDPDGSIRLTLREAWRHPLVFEYINSKFDYVLQPVNEDFGSFVVPPEKGAELNDVLKTLIPISDLPAVRRVVIDKATRSIFTSGSVMVRPFHFSVDGIKLLPDPSRQVDAQPLGEALAMLEDLGATVEQRIAFIRQADEASALFGEVVEQ